MVTSLSQPSSPLRQRKAQRTREQIVATTLELSAARGYDSVTVEDIAEQALMSARTVYRYFGSKEEILFAEDEELLAVVLAGCRKSSSGASFAVALDGLIALGESLADRHAELCARQRIIEDVPALQARTRVKLERWVHTLADLLMSSQNGLGRRDAELVAQAAVLCWRWAYSEWISRKHPRRLPALIVDAAERLRQHVAQST